MKLLQKVITFLFSLFTIVIPSTPSLGQFALYDEIMEGAETTYDRRENLAAVIELSYTLANINAYVSINPKDTTDMRTIVGENVSAKDFYLLWRTELYTYDVWKLCKELGVKSFSFRTRPTEPEEYVYKLPAYFVERDPAATSK